MNKKVIISPLVLIKLIKCRVLNLPTASFCKICGRDVRDFIVPDDIWAKVEPHIHIGHTLCYNCFCDICYEIGLPATWHLVGTLCPFKRLTHGDNKVI